MISTPTPKQPLKIIMDSNAFFVPLQFRIDIFAELERLFGKNITPILLSSVKKELQTLAQQSSPKIRKEAIFALNLSDKCKYIKIRTKTNELTDDTIVDTAKKWNVPVFTNDKLLKVRLKDISVPVIYVREKSRLEIDGMI
jgi:rRNA-processing protein FCF1